MVWCLAWRQQSVPVIWFTGADVVGSNEAALKILGVWYWMVFLASMSFASEIWIERGKRKYILGVEGLASICYSWTDSECWAGRGEAGRVSPPFSIAETRTR